ncbi:MAG: carbamoyl-phosphate synthase large subunit [Deltaproteobacteria bacterium]|nr:carbamoyl-phosphate synthase large subunit [Deltaproteobacteria bacterium]
MPRRDDLKSVLILGSGPIVIGQACEFDYSGTQAVKAIREEGIRVILLNSNPATIMTDPEFADRTYIEPLTPEVVDRILEVERPTALLPTLGGQTALNLAIAVAKQGILEKHGVQLIGATVEVIEKAEDRQLFKEAMAKIGLEVPKSRYVTSLDDARAAIDELGFPMIIRPSFTLGGSGGSIAFNREELDRLVSWGLSASPVHSVLVEESVLGWKEFELEVMRDKMDNVVIVCSIENFDPMGVHTGDSITVAPAQTLTDKEYQGLRDASIRIIREIGVETGGSNIQFAVSPEDGRVVVIEMNPRVSRSSALASKATGFPIAKIAAKLAIGYTLDEITNDITRETPACFEPTIDYVVTKIPRFTFEKFPGAKPDLGPQMKSVGEAMAMGRTFKESLSKAVQSLEIGRLALTGPDDSPIDLETRLREPQADRLWAVARAMAEGMTVERVHELTAIDPWFLDQMRDVVLAESALAPASSGGGAELLDEPRLRAWKKLGISDAVIGQRMGIDPLEVRARRKELGVEATFLRVDTCAAEFEAHTPYLYSTYEDACDSAPTDAKKVVILGGGPNRIGQGIEFDYCCVHAAFALKEHGFETIMVNCNPETVSTDYDTSDRLYFEPLTFEHVMNIVDREKPIGVIVQFGGQTPLRLSVALEKAGVPIVGTSPDSIDRAEDRERFHGLLDRLGLDQPPGATARSRDEALAVADKLGYPVLVRPSYVLGGRAMTIVYERRNLERYIQEAIRVAPEHPVLIDRFLEDAIEVDVDAICDGHDVFVAGVLEHIEHAGVHSGDSAMCLPPHSLAPAIVAEIERQTKAMALELGVRGLMNVQYAIQGERIYILEVNPRASRTVPFVSKAIGIPLAKVAARIMLGRTLADQGISTRPALRHAFVKESVFPFVKFPGVDTLLGPEMRSTGEVMGIDETFPLAFAKAQLAAGSLLPRSGTVFISVRDEDKKELVPTARKLAALGFRIIATGGTQQYLNEHGVAAERVNKVKEARPHVVDAILDGRVDLVINTPQGGQSLVDSFSIRRTALERGIPLVTNLTAAHATADAIEALSKGAHHVIALQDLHAELRGARTGG